MTARLWLGWLQRGLLVVGILLLAHWAIAVFDSRSFQAKESLKLDAALREAASGSSGTSARDAASLGSRKLHARPRVTASARVLGRLEVPRLAITAMVAEGTDLKTLSRAVGHVVTTALPGSPGNCALAGHRDTFLRGLGGVRMNDVIRIVTRQRTYNYQVDWTAVVEPRQVEVLDSTATPSLTLVTCYPFEYIGHAPHRFVVRARQIEPFASSGALSERLR
jgi:sortase A